MNTISLLKAVQPYIGQMIPSRLQYNIFDSYLRAQSIRYRGQNVECRVCGTKLDHWIPSPGSRDDCCPRCMSTPTTRLLWHFLHDELGISDGARILQIAPGWGIRAYFRRLDSVEYYTNDHDTYASYKASPFADFDFHITDIPDDVGTFDVIICSHVLEHVDDQQAMREFYNILRDGGYAIIMVPVDDALEETKVFDDASVGEHQRKYGQDSRDRFAVDGFNVEVIHYAPRLDATTRKRFGLHRDDEIFLCRR